MEPVRIAFAGLMRSGKDTCADYIVSKYGASAMKFADPLYESMYAVQGICGLPQVKDRKFLQWFGTEFGRSIDPNIWVNILIRKLQAYPTAGIVISDARFVNEFAALKEAGFLLVKIQRPEGARLDAEGSYTKWQKFLSWLGIKPKAALHASERDVLTYTGFDLMIDNDRSLEQLYWALDQVVDDHFK